MISILVSYEQLYIRCPNQNVKSQWSHFKKKKKKKNKTKQTNNDHLGAYFCLMSISL